jgi:signal transduction histidine kinase
MGVVSHELRTPVTSLKVFAQLMQKRFAKSGDVQNADLLLKMSTQIDKLTRLIEGLIDITRIEAGHLQLHATEFDLIALVDEIIEEMQRTTMQHTIVRQGTIEGNIHADRDRIGQVLTNLLSNAIKYSPYTDKILVTVSIDEARVRVSVQDFGPGILLDKQEQLFQRFYRVEEKGLETIPGMGLGLYISAEMIKQHGGQIEFVSTPGQGSTFSFSLPLLFPGKEVRHG